MSAPKLLDKKTINREIAAQTKQQIDAGIVLSKKVDAVRDTLLEEEGNLERFRSQTVSIAQKEIDALIQKRGTLLADIKELEKERTLLQMPLDAEWEKLKSSYLKYADQVGTLESAKETVARQIGENTMLAHELDVEHGRVSEMKRITEEKLLHATDDLSRAREESSKMRNLAQTVLSSAEFREKVVIQREKDFQSLVEWVEKEKERISLADKDLERREKVLKDRYATLERTLNRK